MFDYSILKGKIKERYGTQEKFARNIGMSRSSLSQKMSNKVEFTQLEMKTAMGILGVPVTEIPRYFFTLKVEKTKQLA